MTEATDSADVLAMPQTPDAIEVRHLRAFVAVAEELNFSRAATRLYVTQPALSRQIRTLERLVGCDLLRRSTHRVELTLAGEALLDKARALLADLDSAVATTRSVGGELVGRVNRMWAPMVDEGREGELQKMREAYEGLLAQAPVPDGVTVLPITAGGVPALHVTGDPARSPTVLHLHGGGFVLGSAYGYRSLAAGLAQSTGAGVLVPDYRLAPEHPFPAALDDARNAYLWLLERDVEPDQVIVSRGLVRRRTSGRADAVAARPRPAAAGRRGTALPGPGPRVRPDRHLTAGRPTTTSRRCRGSSPGTCRTTRPATRWSPRCGPT